MAKDEGMDHRVCEEMCHMSVKQDPHSQKMTPTYRIPTTEDA
jgi:hypothetical protein